MSIILKKAVYFIGIGVIFAFLMQCKSQQGVATGKTWNDSVVEHVYHQLRWTIDTIESKDRFMNPVTCQGNKVLYCGYADWRSGFFPGSVWYLYELTGDSTLLPLARKYTESLYEARQLKWHHDIGFIINCSYGNAFRLSGNEDYKAVMIEAAQSLCTRFREKPGVIQSWNVNGKSWQSQRGWECPVIIDNMMNLELLFEATRLSGDSSYYKIAVAHADRTLKEHFRPDGSCFHVIDYSISDGTVRHRHTAQGFSHESAWSRGQAWAIYGYTMCYRYTREPKYLDQAVKTFNFMKNHERMPADCIPYWDMDAPGIPREPRDVSSAAVMASALYELSVYVEKDADVYKGYADKILATLSTKDYTAPIGKNGGFVLMHSVGSIPHNSEIDVPLNYADYYYLEALTRKMKLEKYNAEGNICVNLEE